MPLENGLGELEKFDDSLVVGPGESQRHSSQSVSNEHDFLLVLIFKALAYCRGGNELDWWKILQSNRWLTVDF